jgi:hypothetical protein
MVNIRCSSCKTALAVANYRSGTHVDCPKCKHSVLVDSSLPLLFDDEEIERLNDLHSNIKPGSYVKIASLIVMAIIILIIALSHSTAVAYIGLFLFLTTVITSLILTAALDKGYDDKHMSNFKYKLPPDSKAVFCDVNSCLDNLSQTITRNIIFVDDTAYEYSSFGRCYLSGPRYCDLSIDVYCFETSLFQLYFLPDCLLFLNRNKFYTCSWRNISIEANKPRSTLRVRVRKSRDVMVHGRIRKDGGLDLRYNTRHQRQYYWEYEYYSLDEKGQGLRIKLHQDYWVRV